MMRKYKKQNRYANAVGNTGDPYSLVGKRFRKSMKAIGKNLTKLDNSVQVVEARVKSKKKRLRA